MCIVLAYYYLHGFFFDALNYRFFPITFFQDHFCKQTSYFDHNQVKTLPGPVRGSREGTSQSEQWWVLALLEENSRSPQTSQNGIAPVCCQSFPEKTGNPKMR